MKLRKQWKSIHEGDYLAEVEITLIEDETGWSPYISIEDAHKLDDIRDALRRRDLAAATKLGRVYELHPVVHP